MKNIFISCISLFPKAKYETANTIQYESEDFIIEARQTNEACAKFLLEKLSKENLSVDKYICVKTTNVTNDDNTMIYLRNSINEFCNERNIKKPDFYDCDIAKEDELNHRFDRILMEISDTILDIAGDDNDIVIHLDMAGGKRDNYILIQLLTKLMSFNNYEVHTYYADITDNSHMGTIVNTDLSFRHMKILDAVNVFIQFGSATQLRECFSKSKSIEVRNLLSIMEDFSNSLQLCSTDLADIMKQLNTQIENTVKNVSYDKDDLFVIKTMMPLIRQKFNIEAADKSHETLNIIKWCLKNNMIQQALTIYNERIIDLIMNNKFIVIDQEIYGQDIKQRMSGNHLSKKNSIKLRLFLGMAFEKMYNSPNSGKAEMKNIIGKYKGSNKKPKRDSYGNIICHNLEWTIGSVFFEKKFLPDHMTINIDDQLLRNILSDICFSNSARNRVNHASESDSYSKMIIAMFSLNRYPFSSYPNTFTPKNVKKDLLRAVKNIEAALDS